MTRRTAALGGFTAAAASVLGIVACAEFGSAVTSSSVPPAPSIATIPSKPLTPCRTNATEDHDLVVHSSVYQTDQRVKVHLTPCAAGSERPLPVLYLLHGAGADETQWPDVGASTAADAAVVHGSFPPAVIVIPDAKPAYTCTDCQADLTTHLLREIEPRLAAYARIDTGHRAIGGISRGGGLALSVAANHPDDFVAVGGHSPVDVPETELDVLAVRLPVYLDVGRNDSLVGSAEQMAEHLKLRGGNVQLTVNRGGHDRPYWRAYTPAYLDFYGRYLR
jgi:enterochelin esterase-like enzyme